MSTKLSNVGKCIRIAQEAKEVKTREICEQLGICRQQLQRWRRQENLKLHTVQQFAGIFGMSVNEFISLDERVGGDSGVEVDNETGF